MSDEARRVYLRFADFFLLVGGVFLLIGIVRVTLLPDVLRGDPTLVALLLLTIGGGLRWTVRDRSEAADDDHGDGHDEGHDEGHDDDGPAR